MMKDLDSHLPQNFAYEGSSRPNASGYDPTNGEDLSRYLDHITHLDLPLSGKMELLRVVYNIMQSFVDRAFGDDPVQLARKDGDEIQNIGEADSTPMIASTNHTITGDEALASAFAERTGKAKRKETC